MTWFNSIAELPYYDTTQPCYYEPLALPTDMILQGSFPPVANITGFIATLYSADGLTNYEDVTTYFDIYYFKNPINGLYYFNARLNRYSPEMCVQKCWIIEFQIFTDSLGIAFDKYTPRYATATCCEVATGVYFDQDGLVASPNLSLPTSPTNSLFTDDCGDKLVRLISRFPCYDAFTGDYYATPTEVIGPYAATFTLTKVTSMRGRLVSRPREITMQISYNCKLQRAESARQFLLESYDIYPAWKMVEIENQLHAPYKWVETERDYKEYQFTGGAVFNKVEGARNCTEYFKLEANLSGCVIRQTFGCEEGCDTTYYQAYASFFIVPQSYNGGNVYDSSKTLIATDINGLVDWLRANEGVTDVQILATESGSPIVSPVTSPISCGYDYVIGIKVATQDVYIPTNIYYNSPIAANRIYSVTFNDISEVCELLPVTNCATPILDYYTLSPIQCSTPALDYYILDPIAPEEVEIFEYLPEEWEFVTTGSPPTLVGTSATVFNNQVVFEIKVRNYGIPAPEATLEFQQTRIGIISAGGRPQSPVTINSENSNLLDNQFVVIDAQGIIYYTGPFTAVSFGNYTEITLTNLSYNI